MKVARSPIPVLAKYLPPDPVIVDAGAADGQDTIRYADAFPSGRVLAFEPLRSNFLKLEAMIAIRGLSSRVQAFRVALGARTKTGAKFWPSQGADGKPWPWSGSLKRPTEHLAAYPWVEFGQPIEVDVVRLDAVLDRADFLHVDVQGAELDVLEGAGELLKTTRAIWIEVAVRPLYDGEPTRADVAGFLSARGWNLEVSYTDEVDGDELWIRQP